LYEGKVEDRSVDQAPIDTRTIIALLAVGDAALPAALALYGGDIKKEKMYAPFMLGKVLQALAWVLLGLRGLIPDIVSACAGNSIIFCGYALEIAALTATENVRRGEARALSIIALVGIAVFWTIPLSPTSRLGAASVVMAAIFVLGSAYVFTARIPKRQKLALGPMFVLATLAFAARGFAGFSGELTLLSNDILQHVTFLLLYFIMLADGITFLLIQKQRGDRLLAEAESKYHSLIETANEAIVIIRDERIVYANHRSAELFKRPLEAVVGESMLHLVPLESREEVRRFYAERLGGKGPAVRFDLQIQTQPGRTRWVLVSVSNIVFEGRTALLAVLTDIEERKRDEERIKQLNSQLEAERNQAELLAVTDGLTGLANRRSFDERLAAEFYRLKRSCAPLSLAMIDVDHFKAYNDALGHPEGDICLKRIAAAIADAARRPADIAARYGGEEFAVIMPETERDGILARAESIRSAVEALAIPHPSGRVVTISLGAVTALPSLLAVPERIVELADQALYRAKAEGRNRVESATPALEQNDIFGSLARLTWRESDRCGEATIDAEHKNLIERANSLLEAVLKRGGKEELGGRIAEFLTLVQAHFRDEEAILARAGFPGLEEHRGSHARLLAKAQCIFEGYSAGRLDIAELFSFIAYDVVLTHMHVDDREFFPYLGNCR
jgi:PAS domain S-box/diguanylate cyclase (GGDEF) domain/hemerythrin-like metal-binding domain